MMLVIKIKDQTLSLSLISSAEIKSELSCLGALEEEQRTLELNKNYKWLVLLLSAEVTERPAVIHALIHVFSFSYTSLTTADLLFALVHADYVEHGRALIDLEVAHLAKSAQPAREPLALSKIVNQAFISALYICQPGKDRTTLVRLKALGAQVELRDRANIPWLCTYMQRADSKGDAIEQNQYRVLCNLLNLNINLSAIRMPTSQGDGPTLLDLVVRKYKASAQVKAIDQRIIVLLILAGIKLSNPLAECRNSTIACLIQGVHSNVHEALMRTKLFLEEYIQLRSLEPTECFSRLRQVLKSPCTQENKIKVARICLVLVEEAIADARIVLLNFSTISAHPAATLSPAALRSNLEGRLQSQILDLHNEAMARQCSKTVSFS